MHPPTNGRSDRDAQALRARAQRKRLAWHFAGYALVVAVLVAVNRRFTPDEPWFVVPMVGWGAVLALHVAYVMGLFDALRGDRRRDGETGARRSIDRGERRGRE